MSADKKRLIGLIHVAKTDLGMAEESYRAHLQHYGQHNSCKDMNLSQLIKVMDGMTALGFKAKPAKVGKPKSGRLSPKTPENADERSVIRAIWIFMHRNGFIKDGTETALNDFVKRQTAELNNGMGINEVEWLQQDQAIPVLESLKKWCRRCMFDALKKQGYSLFPQMSYFQLLAKWEKIHGAKP